MSFQFFFVFQIFISFFSISRGWGPGGWASRKIARNHEKSKIQTGSPDFREFLKNRDFRFGFWFFRNFLRFFSMPSPENLASGRKARPFCGLPVWNAIHDRFQREARKKFMLDAQGTRFLLKNSCWIHAGRSRNAIFFMLDEKKFMLDTNKNYWKFMLDNVF